MSQKPNVSIFSSAKHYTTSSSINELPITALERRHTVIYSQGLIKPENRGTIESIDSMPIMIKTCQPITDFAATCKELNIPNDKLPSQECYQIETAQKWLTLKGKNGKIHKFPLNTILPKVQMTKHVPAKQLPRDVEVDRRRRIYNKVQLEKELEREGLTKLELMPTEEQYYLLTENSFKHFLPLSFFDDTDFDCHSPEAWLKLGEIETGEMYPLPAKAYLPLQQSLLQYEWQNSSVFKYDAVYGKWSVRILEDECVYEVPKIQIMFLAENPFDFIRRLKQSIEKRNNAETLISMQSLVDCVLCQDIAAKRLYRHKLVDKLMAGIQCDAKFYEQLRLEIYILYEHLMTSLEFEKFIKLLPLEFPNFKPEIIRNSLHKAFNSDFAVEERSSIKALKIDITARKTKLLTFWLLYTFKGFEALINVNTECQYIETLNMFIGNFAKPLALSDFLKSQQKQTTNISNYLKTTWPCKLSNGIILVLRALGKGWLDISLNNWKVFEISKISRFILQVKFRMQESMQVLLEKSIESFTNMLSDPCKQFLLLNSQYQWSSDFINTEFPFNKPIFAMVLSVTEEKEVVYSTPPEEFAPALKELFKKGLEKTSGVRQIDAECLSNLRFASDLYILTVELVEELYVKCNDLLQECYLKAILPLRSYAHKYDRYIEFYLLSVPSYMSEYKAAKKSSMQVKADILEHKRNKEEMRLILPATINIGPFLVIVEPMKQYMIKKRIEIVKKIFEYYVDRMFDTNERLLERCLEMYQKINEKPQSIEHLYAIRDFAITIPDLVDQLRADIQIMWLEYDMLDSFLYNLPDHQFAMKWEVYAWPKTILERLTTLREEQKLDIEDFKRLHLSECIGFEERLESLNDEIQQFSLQFNPQKVTEVAVEIKKTWKVILDLQKLGEILHYRQELFELEELSLEFLNSIIKGFLPYKNLWYACQDMVKLEEATLGNPLVNIELNDVYLAMDAIQNSLQLSLQVFAEKPEIQEVAKYFLNILEQFKPKYQAIKDLKNENWLFLHWQELATRSGLDIKYSMAMNFQYCMRKGIMDHLELVHDISEKATNEADAIRKAFEEEERRKEEERLALLMHKAMRKCRTDIC
ncbi:dynein axonemal heavy chain 1 [Lucilia cuprina]|uniref:dynein axonemal heavy chain 1 n=1 Tax=Lucilia cuprina TaxID=7375 RepID=UPI001F05B561|nr:dynein axonemal heavy chain 1 [Lucilia cuprina]